VSPGERVRLFVALELPLGARAALGRWRDEALRGLSGLRPVPPVALHATLCFLGWRERSEIEQIGAACATALEFASAGRVSLGTALWLPRRRPRVLAVGIEDPSGALAAVQADLAGALSAGAWYVPETRPFLGHVTVARAGRGVLIRGGGLPEAPSVTFTATRVTLFRSRLERAAARYEPLRAIEIGA
jgi:2'-5' RNA ligase